MATLLKIWSALRRVPSAIWLGLTIFVSGALLMLRVMGTHYKVKEVREDAERKRGDIDDARRDLRDAAEDCTNERLREELLRGLKK